MGPLSPAIERFINDQIESLAQLEALLVLRAGRDRAWTCEEVNKHLYLGDEECAAILTGLAARGFVVRVDGEVGRHQYRPKDPDVDALVGELSEVYPERRVAVITQIYSKPIDKVQTFADAFRFRKKES